MMRIYCYTLFRYCLLETHISIRIHFLSRFSSLTHSHFIILCLFRFFSPVFFHLFYSNWTNEIYLHISIHSNNRAYFWEHALNQYQTLRVSDFQSSDINYRFLFFFSSFCFLFLMTHFVIDDGDRVGQRRISGKRLWLTLMNKNTKIARL